MAELTTEQYDRLERAVASGKRIAVWRRGTEYVVVPDRLRSDAGRELIEARNPTTGDHMKLYVDEIDGFEVVG